MVKRNKSKKNASMLRKKPGVADRVEVRMQVPRMRSHSTGLVISNREFLAGIGNPSSSTAYRGGASGVIAALGSGPYTANYGSIYIAPSAFPWLGVISKSYANYKFKKVQFYYVPTIPNTKPGLICLVSFPNADDGPNNVTLSAGFTASQIGRNAIQGPAWDPNLKLEHDCARYTEYKPNIDYVNIGTSDPTGAGIIPRNYASSGLLLWFYDPAGTDGVQYPGRIYCEYEVELMDPVFYTTSS